MPVTGEFDEFQLDHLRVGQSYVLPARLASLLIIGGYAELVDSHPARSEAADYSPPRFPKRE